MYTSIDVDISQCVQTDKSNGGVTWSLVVNDTRANSWRQTPGTDNNGAKYATFAMIQKRSNASHHIFWGRDQRRLLDDRQQCRHGL
jgi:hypothetical protein